MKRALIITGIGDKVSYLERAASKWAEQYDLEPIVYAFGWDGERNLTDKRLDTLRGKVRIIRPDIIIGVSAGASAGAIIAAENSHLAYANVCGRLHVSGNSLYKFANYTRRSPIFVETVGRAEPLLHKINRQNALTFRPYFDELVPRSAVLINGAPPITIPVIGHSLGIYAALRFYGGRIARLAVL